MDTFDEVNFCDNPPEYVHVFYSSLEYILGGLIKLKKDAPTCSMPLKFTDFTGSTSLEKVFGEPSSYNYKDMVKKSADIGQIARMIECQSKGQAGPLFVHPKQNIFPLKCADGKLCIGNVYRPPKDDKWFMYILSYDIKFAKTVWPVGFKVFHN